MNAYAISDLRLVADAERIAVQGRRPDEIVGSYFKQNNDWKMPIDQNTARVFMDVVKAFREGQ